MLDEFHATSQQINLDQQTDEDTSQSSIAARLDSSVSSELDTSSLSHQDATFQTHFIVSELTNNNNNNSSLSSSPNSQDKLALDQIQTQYSSSRQELHVSDHNNFTPNELHTRGASYLNSFRSDNQYNLGTGQVKHQYNLSTGLGQQPSLHEATTSRALTPINRTLAHSSSPHCRTPLSMSVGSSGHQNGDLVPTAHSSTTSLDQQHHHHHHNNNNNMHYSLPTAKNLPISNPANMALNFSHDLLLQTGHHSQTSSHHNNNNNSNSNTNSNNNHHHNHHNQDNTNDNVDIKPQHLSNSFELDSGSLMQSAAAVGMWKNSMGLGHFKHHSIGDHSFLPSSSDFSTWTTHGNNLGQQAGQAMTHHILEGQHLIGYPQHHHHHHHQRSLPMGANHQDLASLKGEHAATSFMLNSINHQAAAVSASHSNPISSHHTTTTSTTTSSSSSSSMTATHQPHDNHLNIRAQPSSLDHCAATSYSLAMNDNQFYNSSRAENRSHQSPIKAPQVLLAADRSVQLSLANHHASHVAYNNTHNGGHLDHSNPQPTTSGAVGSHHHNHLHHHHLPGSSSGLTSKNIGTFRCPHCSETFNMRNLYQSHLKTHSQDKGEHILGLLAFIGLNQLA